MLDRLHAILLVALFQLRLDEQLAASVFAGPLQTQIDRFHGFVHRRLRIFIQIPELELVVQLEKILIRLLVTAQLILTKTGTTFVKFWFHNSTFWFAPRRVALGRALVEEHGGGSWSLLVVLSVSQQRALLVQLFFITFEFKNSSQIHCGRKNNKK